jgi:hAT family C-terminal dimerisation region
LAICAHFTTYELKRQKALLALKKVLGHSGDN